MNIEFDVKDRDCIVVNGHVVMSRTEEPYLRRLIGGLQGLPITAVLEVGYGLGIAAGLVQEVLRPQCHHIVEVEAHICRDCARFCRGHAGAVALFGDCHELAFPRTYDFLFFDPYDYDFALGHVTRQESFSEELNREVVLAHRVLCPGGFLCHTFFGTVSPPHLAGFTLHDNGLFQESDFLLHTGATESAARLGYYRKTV